MQKNDSQSAKTILSRLKKHLKVRTDKELSLILEVQPNTISSWKKRDTLDFPLIISICKLYKIDLNVLFLENAPAEKREPSPTPLVSRETVHEYTNGEIEDITDLPHYHLPFINNKNSRIFQVNSNNMFPVLEENAFAICEKTNLRNLENNSVTVIISKKKGFFINRVQKTKNSLLLFNDNSEHKEQIELKLEMVDELWKVIGLLDFNTDKSNYIHWTNLRVQKLETILAQSKPLY